MYYLAPPLYCDKPRFLWVSSSKKTGDFCFLFFFSMLCCGFQSRMVVVAGGGGGGGGGGCGCG